MIDDINSNNNNLINLDERINRQSNKLLFDNLIDEKKKVVESLLTLDELCEWLKVKRKYIYDLVHKRTIPFIKLRKHLRFEKKTVQQWLDNGCPEWRT